MSTSHAGVSLILPAPTGPPQIYIRIPRAILPELHHHSNVLLAVNSQVVRHGVPLSPSTWPPTRLVNRLLQTWNHFQETTLLKLSKE